MHNQVEGFNMHFASRKVKIAITANTIATNSIFLPMMFLLSIGKSLPLM